MSEGNPKASVKLWLTAGMLSGVQGVGDHHCTHSPSTVCNTVQAIWVACHLNEPCAHSPHQLHTSLQDGHPIHICPRFSHPTTTLAPSLPTQRHSQPVPSGVMALLPRRPRYKAPQDQLAQASSVPALPPRKPWCEATQESHVSSPTVSPGCPLC